MSAGVASFSCSIAKPRNGYTLTTSNSAGLTNATSNAFNVVVGPASKFIVSRARTGRRPDVQATGITLTATDAGGNVVTTYAGIAPSPGPGSVELVRAERRRTNASVDSVAIQQRCRARRSLNADLVSRQRAPTVTATQASSFRGSTSHHGGPSAAVAVCFTSFIDDCSSAVVSHRERRRRWTSKVSTADAWRNVDRSRRRRRRFVAEQSTPPTLLTPTVADHSLSNERRVPVSVALDSSRQGQDDTTTVTASASGAHFGGLCSSEIASGHTIRRGLWRRILRISLPDPRRRSCAVRVRSTSAARARTGTYFVEGGELLFGQHHRYTPLAGGLHLYANYPTIQIGPLSLLARCAAPTSSAPTTGRVAGAVVMTAGRAGARFTCSSELPLRVASERCDERFLQLTVLLGGLMVVQSWATLAVIYAHLDDVLVLAAGIGALWAVATKRPVLLGVCIGVAIAAKPWGVLVLPLAFALRGRARWISLLSGLGIGVVAWAPFVLGDSRDARCDQAADHGDAGIGVHLSGRATGRAAWTRPVQLGVLLGAMP